MFLRERSDTGTQLRFSVADDIGGPSVRELRFNHEPLDECPHCGGNARMYPETYCTHIGIRVRCEKCGCGTKATYDGYTVHFDKEKRRYIGICECVRAAADAWNKRHRQAVCESL